MKTFLLPDTFSPDSALTLAGEDFHYLVRVLRLRAGDTFSGTDRSGNRHLLRIVETKEKSLTAAAESSEGDGSFEPSDTSGLAGSFDSGGPGESLEPSDSRGSDISLEPSDSGGPEASRGAGRSTHSDSLPDSTLPEIHLFQCLLKGKKMDGVIRQAVEAGVHRLVPVKSEYTIPDFDKEREKKKRRRWEAIVREAVQQSGSRVVTGVAETMELSEIEGFLGKNDLGLFFHHEPLEQSPLHRYLSLYPKRVAIAIGPEGGFSSREVEELRSAGFSPVHLHTNVLRAETAAVYALGAVQTILTERAFWKPTTVDPR